MLKKIIIIALRNFKRRKFYSMINIFGLAIGIATAILIFLYVGYESGFDRFHQKSDRIYRVAVDALAGNTVIKQTFNPAPMPAALYTEYAEIEAVCRIADWGDCLVAFENKVFSESNVQGQQRYVVKKYTGHLSVYDFHRADYRYFCHLPSARICPE